MVRNLWLYHVVTPTISRSGPSVWYPLWNLQIDIKPFLKISGSYTVICWIYCIFYRKKAISSRSIIIKQITVHFWSGFFLWPGVLIRYMEAKRINKKYLQSFVLVIVLWGRMPQSDPRRVPMRRVVNTSPSWLLIICDTTWPLNRIQQ